MKLVNRNNLHSLHKRNIWCERLRLVAVFTWLVINSDTKYHSSSVLYVLLKLPTMWDSYIIECLLENYALNMPASQSSGNPLYPASLGVDGNSNPDINTHGCTHTSESINPWFQVDLQGSILVTKVIFYYQWSSNSNWLFWRFACIDPSHIWSK